MFTIKSMEQVTSGMIAHMRSTQSKITDYHIGSVARTLIEGPAIELDEFYQRVLYGLLEAIPVAIYHAFGFDAIPAAYAGGVARFSAETTVVDPVPIPAGTVVHRSDTKQRYLTVADSGILSGQSYADVLVRAEYPGIAGNAAVALLDTLSSVVPQITAVTNLDPMIGGKEAESEEERKLRFVAYVGSLSRGTLWALNYAASSATVVLSGGVLEYVARVGIEEGAGKVKIHILGSHGVASPELLAAAQSIIDGRGPTSADRAWVSGYRPSGVEVTTHAMSIRQINIGEITANTVIPGLRISFFSEEKLIDADFIATVRTLLDGVLSSTFPGDIVQANELIDAVLGIPGVKKVIYDTDTNNSCALYESLRLGTLVLAPLV